VLAGFGRRRPVYVLCARHLYVLCAVVYDFCYIARVSVRAVDVCVELVGRAGRRVKVRVGGVV